MPSRGGETRGGRNLSVEQVRRPQPERAHFGAKTMGWGSARFNCDFDPYNLVIVGFGLTANSK